jgi:hypothetical protein
MICGKLEICDSVTTGCSFDILNLPGIGDDISVAVFDSYSSVTVACFRSPIFIDRFDGTIRVLSSLFFKTKAQLSNQVSVEIG